MPLSEDKVAPASHYKCVEVGILNLGIRLVWELHTLRPSTLLVELVWMLQYLRLICSSYIRLLPD
jgi:hypothetical protein